MIQSGKSSSSAPNTIQNTELMKLLESSPSEIENILGNNYKKETFDMATAHTYENVMIDGKKYSKVEISSKDDGTLIQKRFYTNSKWSNEGYEILAKDFIEQYGTDYEYV